MLQDLKRWLYLALEDVHPKPWVNRLMEWPLILLIVANVVAAAMGTLPAFGEEHADSLALFERFSVAVFTLEYVTRIWVCTEHRQIAGRGPLAGRLRYAMSPFALIDLLAILPFYLALLLPGLDLRALRIFRLLRLLKLARHSPALSTLGRVIADERRALGAALLIMAGLVVAASTAIYYAERLVQPVTFGSIPAAMWWALSTLTTVGYGDAVPITLAGRLIGALVMIFGLGMFALPIAIIASGFAREIHRRDFVVTWGMVARVPLFTRLDALSVSRITNLLHARLVQPGTVIFRPGEPSDALYFIASGRVRIDLARRHLELAEGDFFGEMALLRADARVGKARALKRCRLLVLDKSDFHELMQSDGDFRRAVESVADERLAEDETPKD